MHDLVSFNGQIVPAASVDLAAVSAAALYGKGIFTTLAVHDAVPDYWFEHWRRLSRDARKVGVDISLFDIAEIGRAIVDLVQRNGAKNARSRVTFFDARSTELWSTNLPDQSNLLITTADPAIKSAYFRVTLSPFKINSASPLAGVKSCNYLEKILAKNEARGRGFNECIQLNERDEVTTGAMANVFWLKDGEYFTPSLKTGCVPGITRLQVLESLECSEVEADLSELRSADEIFLTSTGLEIALATEFDGRIMKRDSEVPNLFHRFG